MPVLCWALLQQLGLQRELPKSPAGCPALLGLLSNCWFIPFAHPNRNPARTGAWGIFLTLASCTEIKKGHMWGWEATGKRLAHLKTLPHLAHSLLCRFPQPLSLYGLPSIISSYYCLSPLIKCTLRVGRDFCPLCLLRQPQWLKPFLAHNGHSVNSEWITKELDLCLYLQTNRNQNTLGAEARKTVAQNSKMQMRMATFRCLWELRGAPG